MKVYIFRIHTCIAQYEYELIIADSIYEATTRLRDILKNRENEDLFDLYYLVNSLKCHNGNNITI